MSVNVFIRLIWLLWKIKKNFNLSFSKKINKNPLVPTKSSWPNSKLWLHVTGQFILLLSPVSVLLYKKWTSSHKDLISCCQFQQKKRRSHQINLYINHVLCSSAAASVNWGVTCFPEFVVCCFVTKIWLKTNFNVL